MKNINKPLPDGGVALPHQKQGRVEKLGFKKREGEGEEQNEIQFRTHLMSDNTVKSSLTHIIQYNILE